METYIYTIVWHFSGCLDTELDPFIFFDLDKAIKLAKQLNNEEQHAHIYKNAKDAACGFYRTLCEITY